MINFVLAMQEQILMCSFYWLNCHSCYCWRLIYTASQLLYIGLILIGHCLLFWKFSHLNEYVFLFYTYFQRKWEYASHINEVHIKLLIRNRWWKLKNMNQHIYIAVIFSCMYMHIVLTGKYTSILFPPLLSAGEFTTELIQIFLIISLFIHLCLGAFKMERNQLQLKNGKNNMGRK